MSVSLFAMAIAHALIFWQQRARLAEGDGDFASFYTSGLMLRRGEGALLYDRAQQWKLQQEFASTVQIRKGPLPFVRPPFEALIFLPFAYLPYPMALASWSAVKLALLWLTLRLIPRHAPLATGYPSWLEFVLSLGFFPVAFDLFQGQDAIVLLLLLMASLRQLSDGKNFSAGLFLALGLFKFHLVLLLVFILCCAKRVRILGGFVVGAMGLILLSVGVTGLHGVLVYPMYLAALNRSKGVGFAWVHSMPNLRGLTSPFSAPAWLTTLLSLVAIAIVIQVLRTSRRSEPCALLLGYILALIVTVVASPYSYGYDFAFLLVPLLLLSGGFLDQPDIAPAPRHAIGVALLLLILGPIDWLTLILFDRGYLLAVPPILLAIGLALYLRDAPGEARRALRPA